METSGNPLTCKECGAEMLEDSQFCHACGKEVTPSDECPSCHAKLVEGAKFCRKCGSATADETRPHKINTRDLLPIFSPNRDLGTAMNDLPPRFVPLSW